MPKSPPLSSAQNVPSLHSCGIAGVPFWHPRKPGKQEARAGSQYITLDADELGTAFLRLNREESRGLRQSSGHLFHITQLYIFL